MSIYAHIKRCLELSERDIVSAVADRRLAKALLDQLAKVSRPGDGAPKLLLVFARLAGAGVEWIDGALRVEMVGDADVTVVEVLSELGLGMHERVFPSFKMGVPLDEFARAVERVPHMVAPLKIAAATNRRLVLTAVTDEEEDEASPEPSVSISDESLYVGGPRRRTSKEKLATVKDPGTKIQPRTISSGTLRAARKSSKADMHAVRPRIIAPNTGKTLRPAAPAMDAPVKGPAPKPRTGPPPLPPSAGDSAAAAFTAKPASSAKIAPSPGALPKPPPLPRTDERTPAPGPAPSANRSVVGKVPLTRIQVPRGSRPPAVDRSPPSRPPKQLKRASLKPPPKASKPPERRSKTPPPRSIPPKSARSRAPVALSEPPDEEAIDTGWDDPKD
jgi:hypothetical protein